MDVTDALRRIVMRHLVLIALCTFIPLIGFAVYQSGQKPTYTASVQLQVADKGSASGQAATSAADTVIVQIKTTAAVDSALKAAGVKADPAAFLSSNLSVSAVLTAPAITIEVKYTNAQAAVNIAKVLADQTIATIYGPAVLPYQKALDAANTQLDTAKTDLTNATNALNKAGFNPPQSLNIAYTSALSAKSQAVTAQAKAATDVALVFKPTITDPPAIVPDSTLTKIQPYVLVLILGLLLGVGIAAVLESAAPSVVGAAGLSGLFGAPALGYAVGRNGKIKGRITDLALAARLHAAARRVGADTVVIAGDVRCDIPDLAQRLDSLLGGATNQQIHGTVQQGGVHMGPGAPDPKMLNAGDPSTELVARQSHAPALFSEGLSFGEDIPSVWVHPRVVPYDEQVLLLLSTAPVSVAVAVVGAPKGKRKNLLPAIELVETSGWEILGTILADPTRKTAGGL